MRRHDLRPLQAELRRLALSSLGRMESQVTETLGGVRLALLGLLGELPPRCEPPPGASERGDDLLAQHAGQLLGAPRHDRTTRVMVTLPSGAASDVELLRQLLIAGMDIARINLAHDDPAAWTAMVANVRTACDETGRGCRVLVDLAGPKLRTGALEPGPQVVRVRPERNVFGVVTTRRKVVFCDPRASAARDMANETLLAPLSEPLVTFAQPGDVMVVTDTRSRKRSFEVGRIEGGCAEAWIDRTAYLGTGCAVVLQRGKHELAAARLGSLPSLPSFVPLRVDDVLVLTRDQTPGRAAQTLDDGRVEPARIPCTLPEVFDDVRPDQRILFDDGQITGTVLAHDGNALRIRITLTAPGGGRLRAGKGINLPDTELRTAALTPHDHDCLDWVARHADMVGMSFVQRPEDVMRLEQELDRRGRRDVGILLKIETAIAFASLPQLLFAGLRSPPLGVMVARGDLAVEVGYSRLAEVQEEILWLCEAAHVPVVWATQVLDSMARTGMPSRPEVTDAAMGVAAECVMLNKGPHVVEAVRFLSGLLERMQEHRTKKRSLLRRLNIADREAIERHRAPV